MRPLPLLLLLWWWYCCRYPRGESYLDMIQRLEPVISEMEREGESIVIVGHQAVLRVIFGYLMVSDDRLDGHHDEGGSHSWCMRLWQ